jgi:hypothetical protein
MVYKCFKCNKEFSQKSNYDYHINRKKPCDLNKSNNINNTLTNKKLSLSYPSVIPNLSLSYHNNKNDFNNNKNITNTTNNNTETNNIDNNKYNCIYCNNSFTAKSNLSRHIKYYCKLKQSNNIKNNISKPINNDDSIHKLLEQQQQTIAELKEEIIELKQTNTQLCKVSKGKKTSNTSTKTNTSNTSNDYNTYNTSNMTNNGTINNSTNLTNNIIINGPVSFGDEDISRIKQIDILGALRTIADCFTNFVKVINLNEEHPEFQSILFNNLQNNIGTIIENNKPVIKTKMEIVEEIINTRLPDLEDIAEKYYEEKLLTKKEYTAIKELISFLKNAYIETEDVDGNIVKGDKTMVKKLKALHKKIIHMFYDERVMVSKNIKRPVMEPIVEPLLKITNEKIMNV